MHWPTVPDVQQAALVRPSDIPTPVLVLLGSTSKVYVEIYLADLRIYMKMASNVLHIIVLRTSAHK